MIKGFEFKHGERTYLCSAEALQGIDEVWWWFSASGDAQRYAAFRAASSDTRTNVQERVVAYYENRLFQLAQPRERGAQFGNGKRGPKPVPAAAATTVPAATTPAAAKKDA